MNTDSVRCLFHVRRPVGEKFRYDPLALSSEPSGYLTAHPPLIGDLIHLFDTERRTAGTYLVVERAWSEISYGSMAWPANSSAPTAPPILDVILDVAEGPFVNDVNEED